MTRTTLGAAEGSDSKAKHPVVLISGSSAGIGAACASVFVLDGWRVLTCSNDARQGNALQSELNSAGPGRVRFVECDVRSPDQITETVQKAIDEFGGLDVLVNNVGISAAAQPIDRWSQADIENMFKINLMSFIHFTKAALPHIRARRGSIINIGSLAGRVGHEGLAVYCATKGGVAAFSKALAIDEARHGVRVNSILPGNVVTASREQLEDSLEDPQEFHDLVESWQWLGRSADPLEVAEVCAFLASSRASFITGAEIVVSGGADLGFGPKVAGATETARVAGLRPTADELR